MVVDLVELVWELGCTVALTDGLSKPDGMHPEDFPPPLNALM